MGFSNWHHLDFQIIRRETDKAFQVHLDSGEFVWVPKSVVDNARDYQAGDQNGTMSVQSWFAEKEGWE